MKHPSICLLLSFFLIICPASGQDLITSGLKMGFTDIAELKRKAEAGDPAAQFSLAGVLEGQNRPADAMEWYQKVAARGNVEAVYRMGKMLLTGAYGIPADKSVKADPMAGIQLIFIGRYEPLHRSLPRYV